MSAALAVEGLWKSYRSEEVETGVLFDVSLAVEPGEFVAVVGASGSGKTTLLNLMGLLDAPDRGRIRVGELDATGLDEDRRSVLRRDRIGFIFQFHYLLPEFTVLENALMPCRLHGRNRERARTPAMSGLLERVGLGDKLAKRGGQLSGGQQQRVAVVRALANDPTVVLADEPTGNLDSRSGRIVFELMRELSRESGKAFIIVTHDEHFAAEADRVIHLKDGKVQ